MNWLVSREFQKKINKDLHCYMNKLSSFQYLPEEIGGDLFVSDNQFATLEYFPKRIGGTVDIQHNPGEFTEAQVRAVCKVGGDVRVDSEVSKLARKIISEINLPIEIGDTVLGGKFRNRKIVVKEIGTDERGQPTINGKTILKIRILKDEKIVESIVTSKCRR
jgi:hypothetical protein